MRGFIWGAVACLSLVTAPAPRVEADVPAAPGPPSSFLAGRGDPAGRVARILARRIAQLPNFRAARAEHALWLERPDVWSIRPQDECLGSLRASGMGFRLLPWTPTEVPVAVEVLGPVGGVRFLKTRPVPLIVACELASRLPRIAEILASHGVHTVDVMSAYRREPRTSFHSMGLALDFSRFHVDGAELSVEADFTKTPTTETCGSVEIPEPSGRALTEIACDFVEAGIFSTVITPNYNEGHHDHFHVDIRPDDPRMYVR